MTRKLTSTLVLLACAVALHAQTKVIAHRGHWKPEGSAQNSISSLRNAIDIGCYGSEFDVIVTADGVAVVNHDNSIGGFVIEDTPYKKLKNLRLPNGEKLPTLKRYLKAGAKQTGTKLILELKPHSAPEKDIAAAAVIINEVKSAGLSDITEYITFSLVAGQELIRLDPNAKVAYLNGDIAPAKLKELGFSGLDYHFDVMRNNENWFDEAKNNGIEINVWTVNKSELMRYFIDKKVEYITTDNPETLQQILRYE